MTKDEGLYFLKCKIMLLKYFKFYFTIKLTFLAALYTDDSYQENLGDLDRFLTDLFITFPFVKNIPQVVKDVKNFYFYNHVMDKHFVSGKFARYFMIYL